MTTWHMGKLHWDAQSGLLAIWVNKMRLLRGGEYLFMPSLSALRWIGNLDESNSTDQKER
jgi:hypothetical protein